MRIKQISAIKLFGIFDHIIPLNMEERITIIHGPNGFGKTILLRMINGFFEADYSLFRLVPFDSFTVECDNKSSMTLSKLKDKKKRGKNGPSLKIDFVDTNGKRHSHNPNDEYISRRWIHAPDFIIEEAYPERRIVRRTARPVSREELTYFEELPSHIKYGFRAGEEREAPEWLQELQQSCSVRFLDAERLIVPQRGQKDIGRMKRAVSGYSEELASTIRSTLAQYAALSQSLDRSFPVRLVQEAQPSTINDEILQSKLGGLEEKRQRLVEAGLLERETTDVRIPQEIREDTKHVLSVYVEDVDKKLAIFDDIANKLDLMKKIINQRFLYKSMTIDKEKGFVFAASNGQPLSPADLSSGEQHELVLLYELLFKSKRDSLFLIDEPELSLHVAWQSQFLEDLQEIARLGAFDVILATHSASIITDRWDLTVELKGPHN